MTFGSHYVTHGIKAAFEEIREPLLSGARAPPPRPRSRPIVTGRLAMLWLLAAATGSGVVQIAMPRAGTMIGDMVTGSVDRPPAEIMARDEAVALSRLVLLRLDDANRSGNYAVFRDLAAPSFQKMNSTADLERIFSWLKQEGVVLAPAALLDDQSLQPVTREKNDLVHIRGVVPNIPRGLGFDLLLQRAAGEWLVFGIAVYRG